jgi:enterochelin esterase-like enzyme
MTWAEGTVVRELVERARTGGAPVIDDDGATFVWASDESPDGDDQSPPQLIGDFNGWGWHVPAIELQQVAPRVWAHTMRLPPDAYIEYLYLRGEDRILDPLNSRTVSNGVGGTHNWFGMPDFAETPLAIHRAGIPHGTVTSHAVDSAYLANRGTRTVHLYRPPADGPYPVLIVYDGQDYLHGAKLPQIVDNLIADARIRPFAMALIEHGDEARFVEYNCSDATIMFLRSVVLPMVEQQLDLGKDERLHGVMGASMGGLMALYTALRLPGYFGCVLSQSGAFGFHGDGWESVIRDLVRHGSLPPPRVWMDAGGYEDLSSSNRQMHELLREQGFDVTFREYNGGHNYTSWRNDVKRGLESLFPPANKPPGIGLAEIGTIRSSPP